MQIFDLQPLSFSVRCKLYLYIGLHLSQSKLFFNIINNISAITGQLGVKISLTGIGDVYIKIIMKIIGITFITQLISDVCRDNGFNAAASQLEIMCKIAVATISIPIVLSLMEMINKCIK